MEPAAVIGPFRKHRRLGWLFSFLLHASLLAALLVVRASVPGPPPEYIDLTLVELPESDTPPEREQATADAEPDVAPAIEGSDEADLSEDRPAAVVQADPGVKEWPNWVTGPPRREVRVPLALAERIGIATGPIRRGLAERHMMEERVPTALDTLLFIQDRLTQMAAEALQQARENPKVDRTYEPIPRPGSIQELRGEPMLTAPVMVVAGALVEVLTDLGKMAWNAITNRDREAGSRPDMDLTFRQVLAYAALSDREGINLFQWFARLDPEFKGGLADLQRAAAELSDRNLIRLGIDEDLFVYHRTIPLRDVIEYYTSFLSRLPNQEVSRREAIIQFLAVLVRER